MACLGEATSVFILKCATSASTSAGRVYETEREDLVKAYDDLRCTLSHKKTLLTKQVKHLNEEADYDIAMLYSWNKDFGLNDDPSPGKSWPTDKLGLPVAKIPIAGPSGGA